MFSFLEFNWINLIDIFLVSILLYQLYKLIRGTVALNIFIALAFIYLFWKIIDAIRMELLSGILKQFIETGVIILVIVFQQELRKFLILLGRARFKNKKGIFKLHFSSSETKLDVPKLVGAIEYLAKQKTGALIVVTLGDDLAYFAETGVKIEGEISTALLHSVFFYNSPLHDGAVIIRDNKIVAARCVLPITNNANFPEHLGLRHRAAVGISEETDAVVIIVSEQNGKISYAKEGTLMFDCSPSKLKNLLEEDNNKFNL